MGGAFRRSGQTARLRPRRFGPRLPQALGIAVTVGLTIAPAAAASPLTPNPAQPLSDRSPFPAECHQLGTQRSAEATPALAVDPRDPRRVVVAWEQDLTRTRDARGIVVAVSRDGARNFERITVPGLTNCSGAKSRDAYYAMEPTLAFGPDGVLYLALRTRPLTGDPALAIVRSTDGGTTWDAPITLAARSTNPVLVADPALPGRAYLAMTANPPQGSVLQLATTADGGRTWSTPSTIYESLTEFPSLDDLTILPDGKLLALFKQENRVGLPAGGGDAPPSLPLLAIGSPDRGATWSKPVEVGRVPQAGRPHDPEQGRPGMNTGSHNAPALATAAAIDGGAAVAWQSNTTAEDGRILLSRSSDAGASWSEPAPVTSPGTQVFTPELAAGPGGTLGLSWYDFHSDRKGDEELTTTDRFAHSHDGGASWSDIGIGSPFDLRQAPEQLGRSLGIRQGLAPLAGGFVAAFVQTAPETVAGLSDVFATRLTAAAPRMRLAVSPRTVRAGRRTRFKFKLTTGMGASARPVSGARIAFAGRRASSDRRGRAAITARLARPGRYRARATKAGLAPATATALAARRR